MNRKVEVIMSEYVQPFEDQVNEMLVIADNPKVTYSTGIYNGKLLFIAFVECDA
ncbi:hypothetical protein [Niallia sp. RD1]|uniref:hypothetical protein n=1 Tax=Niallia sp. RD1 TaxID=2962858 RepID=UPI0020C1AB24|nr:hypothetical protein [Niallia sp. RD1]UTI41091.1 hypothetical protein NKG37_19845 [Niallia sp. RD1]